MKKKTNDKVFFLRQLSFRLCCQQSLKATSTILFSKLQTCKLGWAEKSMIFFLQVWRKRHKRARWITALGNLSPLVKNNVGSWLANGLQPMKWFFAEKCMLRCSKMQSVIYPFKKVDSTLVNLLWWPGALCVLILWPHQCNC